MTRLISLLLVLSFAACAPMPKPDDTVRQAYAWYLRTVKSGQDPFARARVELKGLATQRFLTSIENLRANAESSGFVDPQNFDARLAVKEVKVNGGAATAHVSLTSRIIGQHELDIYLLREERVWKIDDVKLIEAE